MEARVTRERGKEEEKKKGGKRRPGSELKTAVITRKKKEGMERKRESNNMDGKNQREKEPSNVFGKGQQGRRKGELIGVQNQGKQTGKQARTDFCISVRPVRSRTGNRVVLDWADWAGSSAREYSANDLENQECRSVRA